MKLSSDAMNGAHQTAATVPSRWQRWRLVAVVLGVTGLTVVGWADLLQHYGLRGPAALLLTAIRIAPLGLVRSRPVVAWLWVAAVTVVTALACDPVSTSEPWPLPVTSALINGVVLFIAVQHLSGGELSGIVRRRLSDQLGRGLVAGSMWLSIVAIQLALLLILPDRGRIWPVLVSSVVLAGVLLTALVLRERRETRGLLVEEKRLSATERAQRELLAERARIARELHDIVAHHMSVIAVQAQSAQHRLSDLPPEAAAEFQQIASAARSSLTELRRVLSLLRDGEELVELGPKPGLAEIPEVVANARRAGIDVTLEGLAELPELPPAVALTMYRVVQEALSNVLRHAPGAAVTVQLSETDGAVRAIVRNGPASAAAPRFSSERSGLGLLGMRERAAVHDGTLTATPTEAGGFTVELSLPLPRPPSS